MGLISTKDSNENNGIANDFHFPNSKKALIIFIRNPELGKVKSRLAKTIGNHAALEVYKYLLQHTATITSQIMADRFVFYSETIHNKDLWNADLYTKKLQSGDNLGIRMEQAFIELFQLDYERVIIVGSDLLDLQPEHIDVAFNKLEHKDVVIGPAEDGGYYLLGMKTLHAQVFKNKKWGTSTVFDETMSDLQYVNVHLLEQLNDIDTFEDLKKYSELKKIISLND